MTISVARFAADDQAPRRAREWLTDNATLDRVRRAEASVLLSELVTSALEGAQSPDSAVTVTAGRGNGTVVIGVEPPQGGWFEPDPNGFRALIFDGLARRWGQEGDERIWFEVPAPGTTQRGTSGLATDQLLEGASGVDREAPEELARRFAPFALRLARRFKGKGVSDDDVEQAALFGLVQSLRRYDPSRGPFEPFAAVTITGELKRLLRDRGWAVSVPRPVKERALETGRITHTLTQRLGRGPTPDEIAEEMGVGLDAVLEAQRSAVAYQAGSLDAPVGDGDLAPIDLIGTAVDPGSDWAWHSVSSALEVMSERERQIVEMRYYDDKTQSEIAGVLGISQMHVSRLLNRALGKLQAMIIED